MQQWSTLKKLIWLRAVMLKAAAWVIEKITGSLPLTITNAVAHAIEKLTRYGLCTQPSGIWNTAITQEGKCVQDGTPTPDAPVDIWCNNGRLAFGKPLTLDPTRYYAYIGTSNTWSYSTDSYSIVIPVTVGKKYKITADPTTPIDGSVVNIILRWGFVDTIYDDWKQSAVAPSPISVTIYDWARSTPQDTQSVEVTATHPYMVIQMGAAAFASNLANGRIGVAVQKIYTDGEDEVLTVSGKNLFDPTKVLFGYYRDRITGNKRTSSANFMSSDDGYIPCLPNTAYTFVGTNKTNGTYSKYNTIYFFDSAKNYLGASSYQISQPTTGTTPSNCRYLQVRSNPLDTVSVSIQDVFQQFNWQLELGSTATDYEPYNAQTVTVPMLLGVGDYKDEVELINGIKMGKVGIKVFNGTETFTVSSSGAMITEISDVAIGALNAPMNTHFALETSATSIAVGTQRFGANGTKIYSQNYYMKHPTITTVTDFKAWLASEYTNGTPVIVLYPLATETTEQTTAYPQLCNKLYNTATVTAEVSDVSVAFTTGEQTNPNPYSQLPIMCNNGELKWNGTAVVTDGTPEVLTVGGQNLVDLSAVTDGYYYDPSGVYTAIAVARLTDYIPVRVGQQYTVYVKAERAGGGVNVRCNLFNSAKEWKSQPTFVVNSGGENVGIITPTEDGFLRVSANYTGTGAKADWSTLQIVRGEYTVSTMPPYEPYVQPQTVSVENLFAVDNYKDTQEIISGLLTHKIGIMVFDGTEAWRASSSGGGIYVLSSALGVGLTAICTHFVKASNTTSSSNMPDGSFRGHPSNPVLYFKDESAGGVNGFKANLAAQYAAGTPVIMLYALADETTESVTPQHLNTTEGTNIIDSTSNVSPIDVEVEYAAKKGA